MGYLLLTTVKRGVGIKENGVTKHLVSNEACLLTCDESGLFMGKSFA